MKIEQATRHRPVFYIVSSLLAIGAILWAESQMWTCVNDLRRRAEILSSEVFHLADPLEARIRALNDDVSRYAIQVTPGLKQGILAETEATLRFLKKHREDAMLPSHRDLLTQMGDLLNQYLRHAGALLDSASAPADLEIWRREKERILAQILARTAELGRAEKLGLEDYMEGTHQSVTDLHRKLVLSSLILLSMGAALGYLAYRGLIVPLQFRLRQSQRVIERQEKLSSLGVLAAGVAHEIRNPLTSIKARLFTQQDLLARPSEALEDNVFITEEISRLEKIVADFLSFARPSEPEKVLIRASQPLRDVGELLRASLARVNIELRTEILADPRVHADPDQLKQVLINLVRNAAESIEHDGIIHLRTRIQSRRSSTRSGASVLIEVEDSGKGIAPEDQKRLFDPFFTTKASGTGLGLSIAARILEKHGGTLEYHGGTPHGTQFTLVLPIASNES